VTKNGRRHALLLAAVLLACRACELPRESPAGGDAMSREAFVSTYVDLRISALSTPDAAIEPSERSRILEEHGVTEDELLEFVDAHGADVDFMASVWTEVEDSLEARRLRPGSSK
jgi:hypothetical protein